MAKLIWGSDLYKGFKLPKNALLNGSIDDMLPFQMLSLEEKTPEWIHAVADFYETAGWNNVEKKAGKIQKAFDMRHGILDKSDYVLNPEVNPFHQAVGWITPEEHTSPLEQFYPLIPNFVDVLRGEFIKRDNTWTIEAIDQFSVSEVFKEKDEQFKGILMQYAQLEKQQAMARMGITEETDPEQYMQQLEALQKQMEEVEFKTKNFRTTGVKWAEKVIKIHEKRYNLHELEPDGFECGLTVDGEFWHLDLLDDDFKLELLNPKWIDFHKSPGLKYVSDGDYFLWFDWMSTGDVVNKFGRRMKEEDLLKMKEIYIKTANMIVPDWQKNYQGAYYDPSKSWAEATNLDPKMNDALLGKELAYSFTRNPNFDHNQDVDILNPVWGRMVTGYPQMFRVMRLYWRSLRRIGWLTRIKRDGSITPGEWIDENYKVTVEPVYGNSVVKEKTKDNLIYGEHIDWTWVPEWRHVIKISPNQKHTFWLNSQNTMNSIYIDGGPVKFQFKGKDNPFDSLPPIEGCYFSYFNAKNNSFVNRAKPLQILYNICMNKVPKKMLQDYGNKVAVHRALMPSNNMSNIDEYIDPNEAMEDKLRESSIFDFTFDAEMARGMGQPPLPTVLNLSTIQEAQLYFQLGQQIKWEAGELIGISRQRVGGMKASETATGIQQAINYSETQTEKYFEQHSNLMERVRQRMLDATQYYSTFNESNRTYYLNDNEENVFLDIEGMENTLPHYNIYLQSKANVRAALQTISKFLIEENTLPIKPSAKIQSLVEQSVPKILSLIKQGEVEQDLKEQAERDHALQIEEERRKTLEMQQQYQKELQAQKDEAAYQKDTDVAKIRALGGMQTDVDANAIPDAQQNLQAYLKQQEINNKSRNEQTAANLKRQTDIDNLLVQREKNQLDLQKEKIKADTALKVAKENRTASEIKAKRSASKK